MDKKLTPRKKTEILNSQKRSLKLIHYIGVDFIWAKSTL